MTRQETFYFASANGESEVFTRRWLPDDQPRAVMQIAHGLAEHSGLYADFAQYLARLGFVVTAQDHIGHGQSVAEGQRYGFLAEHDGWSAALSDMEYLRVLTCGKWPGLPYFMFGHSMGSFLLRNYLIEYADRPLNGAICSGTGNIGPLKLTLGDLLVWLEKKRLGPKGLSPLLYLVIQGDYNRQFKHARTRVDWLTSDPLMVDAYLADPFCRKLPTVGLYGDINTALKFIGRTANMRRMDSRLPLLLLSGAKDPVGGNGKAVRKLKRQLEQAGSLNVSLRLYENGRHAMLYEQNRLLVYDDIRAWLEDILSGHASR